MTLKAKYSIFCRNVVCHVSGLLIITIQLSGDHLSLSPQMPPTASDIPAHISFQVPGSSFAPCQGLAVAELLAPDTGGLFTPNTKIDFPVLLLSCVIPVIIVKQSQTSINNISPNNLNLTRAPPSSNCPCQIPIVFGYLIIFQGINTFIKMMNRY